MNAWNGLTPLLSALCLTAAAAAVGRGGDDGWTLVFEDHFQDREVPGDAWRVMEGEWAVRDGALTGRGLVAINQLQEGQQRLEVEMSSETPGDLTPILHTAGTSLHEGYFLQFAGVNNTFNQARREWLPVGLDDAKLAEPGRRHRLVAEFAGHRVRLWVDGVEVHDFRETDFSLVEGVASTAGLYLYRPGKVHAVRWFTRPFDAQAARLAAAREPPLPTPDENLLLGGDGEDPRMVMRWNGPLKRTTDDARSGEAALMLDRITSVTSPNWIPIDPSATYAVSGYFRSAQPGQPSRVLLDLRFYTADKQPIGPHAVQPVSEVSRVLEAVPAGQTTVRVAPADWPTEGPISTLALYAEPDRSDLPNFNTHFIDRIDHGEDAIVVTLRNPLPDAIPAGTGARLHRYLDFARVWDNHVPEAWTRYAFSVSATSPPGASPQMRIWPGAAYARVVVFNHYSRFPEPVPEGEPVPVLLFDDLEVRKTDSRIRNDAADG